MGAYYTMISFKIGYFAIAFLSGCIYCEESECFQEISIATTETGSISSPGYPWMYSNNLNCTWVLTTVQDRVIQLEFTDFDVELQCGCDYDAVVVYDSFPDGEIGRFCNSYVPQLITSTSNSLIIKFLTDFANPLNYTGFIAQYNTIPANAECAVLGDPRGVPQPMSYLVANDSFTLFTTMAFEKPGWVSRIDYFGHREGTAFISFWYPTGSAYSFKMRGKVNVTLATLFTEYTIPDTDRVYVQSGDMVAVHYPTAGIQSSLAYEDGTHLLTPAFTEETFIHTALHGFNRDPIDNPWLPGHELTVANAYNRLQRKTAVALRVFTICDCNDGSCSGGCSPNCRLGRCNINNAHCSAGCVAGYYGKKCEQECFPGLYGEDCLQSCGECNDGAMCDRTTGECPTGRKQESCDDFGAFDLNMLTIVLIIVAGVELVIIIMIGIPLCRRKNAITENRPHSYEAPMPMVIQPPTFQRQISNPTSDPPSYKSNAESCIPEDVQSNQYQELNLKTKGRQKKRQNNYTTQNNVFRW